MTITVAFSEAFDTDSGTVSGSHSKTLGSSHATVASSLLIVAVMDLGANGLSRVTSVTDNKSGGTNTWTQICRGDSATSGGSAIFATAVTAGSITQYTLTMTGNGPVCAQFFEVAGAGLVDVSHTNSGTASTISSGSSGTPSGANDLVIAVGGLTQSIIGPALSSPALTTAGGTFAAHNSGDSSGGHACGYTGRLILSSNSAAQTFTFNDDGNGATWGACIALWNTPATTAIKTVGGLTKSSVKTVGGLAIASVKTIGGLG